MPTKALLVGHKAARGGLPLPSSAARTRRRAAPLGIVLSSPWRQRRSVKANPSPPPPAYYYARQRRSKEDVEEGGGATARRCFRRRCRSGVPRRPRRHSPPSPPSVPPPPPLPPLAHEALVAHVTMKRGAQQAAALKIGNANRGKAGEAANATTALKLEKNAAKNKKEQERRVAAGSQDDGG